MLLVEYKSMHGSEGKNLNNRADEIFGMAEDARQAELNGLLPPKLRRAYIFVMGMTEESTRPTRVPACFGGPDEAFIGLSYLQRTAIMLKRMRETRLFHLAWALGVQERTYDWYEPDPDVGWDRFATDLRHAFRGGVPTQPAAP